MKAISAWIKDELHDEIYNMSRREFRKVSGMAAILLEQAVKERNRKRKKPDANKKVRP